MSPSRVLMFIGLAALGTAVLYPIFAPPRLTYHRPTCLSDVKQTIVALQIYQGDFDDRFPGRDEWIDSTYPYVKHWEVYHCPRATGEWGYAFDGALDRARTPPHPETTPLVYDSVNPAKNASDLFTSLPAVPRHAKNSVGYEDGHAKSVAP